MSEKAKAVPASAKIVQSDRSNISTAKQIGRDSSAADSSFPAGNLAMQRLLREGVIRARLEIGRSDDPLEREADAAAEQCGRGVPCNHSATSCNGCNHQLIQRKPINSSGTAVRPVPSTPLIIQPKLAVSQPGDPLEREADAAAETAVSAQTSGRCAGATCPSGGCATCHHPAAIHRKAIPGSASVDAPAPVKAALRSGGHPLDPPVRSSMEAALGADFSNVRVHTGPAAAESARSIQALAYTAGSDVVFNEGQYAPETAEGRKLLAHELAHIGLGHTGIRRWTDEYFDARAEDSERRSREAEERRRHHEAWSAGVEGQFQHDLENQASSIGEERERLDLAITAQRAAAFDAIIAGQGWLAEALRTRGYSGPGAAEIKQSWGEAQIAAETIRLSASTGTITSETRLLGLQVIPRFYAALEVFSRAVEDAHRAHMESINTRLADDYRTRLAAYEERERLDQMAAENIAGEPGATGFIGGLALARGSRPEAPQFITTPVGISGEVEGARTRLNTAESIPEWETVATDVNTLGNGVATLVVATLPESSEARTGLEYLEHLDERLAEFEQTNPVAKRIPAVFYPKDRTLNRTDADGRPLMAPESIPWQFYLINTGVTTLEQPARSGGEWVLVDLTSSQRYETKAPASDLDSLLLREGANVDPPVEVFSELNSRIRFPEGVLHCTLPRGSDYVLETTEPWSLSDWLTAIGLALAAIAIVASLIATGGASTPAAVAFYAGMGAAAAGVGSTLANLHERSEQGVLTNADVDSAMISIGIDVVTAASMGLGRLVILPETAARIGLIGERFIALQRVTQVARAGAIAGDVYQGYSMTSGLVSAYSAIQHQPGLSDEERNRMIAQLTRRALLTGALLVVALRGDVQDFQAGRAMRVSHVDADGALVVHPSDPAAHADTDVPHERVDVPGAGTGIHPPSDIGAMVHAGAGSPGAGAHLTIGPQSHELSVAGTGRNRDFYFCSDLCGPIVDRLNAILAVLPRNHPEREIFQALFNRARTASRRLGRGELTQEETDAVARQISGDIGRHSEQSELFAALMNTDSALLASNRDAIRRRLAGELDIAVTQAGSQRERQEASRGAGGREALTEPDVRSPLETDVLGGLSIGEVDRPGRRLQPIQFDTGNFSHTYAEALVPGLPRGLDSEVPVNLLDGTVGRADRVRFILDGSGNQIGAHVIEIKPNTPDNIARGEQQAQDYMAGLQATIDGRLRAAGIPVPATAPNGAPRFGWEVQTYNFDQMLAVLRALRASRRDASRMADYEAIARQVFGAAQP